MTELTKSMTMRELYKQFRHFTQIGIEGYNLVKKYEDPAAAIKSRESLNHKRKIKQLKRGSYLDDQIYAKKDIPGVSKYNISEKQKPKIIKKKQESPKKTYLDNAIIKSQKDHVPAPGYYNVLQMIGSKITGGNNSKEGIAFEKRKKVDKITYLDNAQYQGSLTPGVGQYTISTNMRSKTQQSASLSKLDRKPQFWRQYHDKIQKQKFEKLHNSGPNAASYHPQPLQYKLFDQNKKIDRAQSQIRLGRLKSDRFKTQSIEQKNKKQLGPGKYNVLNVWAPNEKNKKGILSIISKLPSPSVYYH